MQSAVVPSSPSSPNLRLNLALGGLIGLALGVGLAVLRATFDTLIHSQHDIELVTDAPMLGGITFDPEAGSRPLVVHSDPRNPRAESFRTLRTNLQFLAVNSEAGRRGRSFVVSSAGPAEGKSTTTANLAQYMGLEGGAGLTNVLINQAELPEVMQRWGRGQLYVLPAGKVPPNPSELLGSAAMETLFGALHEHFDYILVDAPPLLVTDVVVVRKHTDGVLLIAASGSTCRQQLEGAVRTLAAAGGKLLGVIVTMLPTKGPDSYAYGAYGAYGGYGKKQAESALTASTGPQPVPAGRERAAAEGSTEGPLRGRRVRSA